MCRPPDFTKQLFFGSITINKSCRWNNAFVSDTFADFGDPGASQRPPGAFLEAVTCTKNKLKRYFSVLKSYFRECWLPGRICVHSFVFIFMFIFGIAFGVPSVPISKMLGSFYSPCWLHFAYFVADAAKFEIHQFSKRGACVFRCRVSAFALLLLWSFV